MEWKQSQLCKGTQALPLRVVEKKEGVEPNTLIFNSKMKEARGAKYAHLDMEVFSWFKQQHSCIGRATKVLTFMVKCSVQEQLSKHRNVFGPCMVVNFCFNLKNVQSSDKSSRAVCPFYSEPWKKV